MSEAETSHGLPWPLPGGRTLLFTVRKRERSWGDEAVVAHTMPTGARRVLLRDAADARYVPTGHLVFMRRGVLFAVPFDAERLEIRGAEVPLLEPVAQSLTSGDGIDLTGAGQFAVSGSGTLAWISNPTVRFPERLLVAVDRRGKATSVGAPIRSYSPIVRVSPDNRLLLVPVASLTEKGLWVYDLARRTLTPLLRDGEVTFPLWSPDGQRIVFEWLKDGRFSIAALRADGTAAPYVLPSRIQTDVDRHPRVIPSSINPNGQRLAAVLGEWGREDLILATLDDRNVRPVRWFETRESEGWPVFSPDGRWIAYASNAAGDYDVYVRPYPGPGPAYQVSVGGGSNPAWEPTGRGLFFVSRPRTAGRQQMMRASVQSESPLRLSAPQQLFEFESSDLLFDCIPARCFDVASDGRRFYVTQSIRGPALPPVTQINLVLNWFEELRLKVPVQ